MGIFHRDLEGQREKLIGRMGEYSKKKGHEVTIVFDGWKSGGKIEDQLLINGVNVIYSRLGEKADAVIKRIVSSGEKHWIVVSSDREISDHAWSKDAVALTADEFLNVLEKSEKVLNGDFVLIEDEKNSQKKKGSPKMPSKRDRIKKRTLSKL